MSQQWICHVADGSILENYADDVCRNRHLIHMANMCL